jgi:molybdenum cofactor synthesis domain-containing protein
MNQDSPHKTVTAALVIIGNEVLSGRTRDANLQYLARGLNDIGIRLMEVRVIADDEAAIVAAVNACRGAYDYLFTTGGIGPTHDDITSACIAKAFGLPFGRNPEAETLLRAHYKPEDVTEARLRMANTPVGATLLENPVSRAPGFQVENVFVLPGVPRIMQAIYEGFKHRLTGGQPVLSKAIAAHVPEGRLAGPVKALQESHPEVEVGSYPFYRDGKLGATIVLRTPDNRRLEAATVDLRALIHGLDAEPIEDDLLTSDGDNSY